MTQASPGFSLARDRRQCALAALLLALALVAPYGAAVLRRPPGDGSVAPPSSSVVPARPRKTTLRLEAAGPATARVVLGEEPLGELTLGEDGGVRGDALVKLPGRAAGVLLDEITIVRDPAVPLGLAEAVQRVLVYGGALDTRVAPVTSEGR